jgi:sugar/nucleoside kinase (ribokinase family)
MTRLVQLSGVILDLIYRVQAVPQPGQEAVVTGFSMAPGGGFNAMVAARRWGMEVAFAGTLGTGPFAERIRAGLATEGITPLRPTPLPGMDQGTCVVLIDAQGERTFIAKEGADGVMTDADLAQVRTTPDDWILLSGYALGYAHSRDALTRFLAARPRGQLVFDPGPLVASIPAPALKAALEAAAWISANAAEATHLTGLPDPPAAAETLAQGRAGAVVRVGADGCFVATGGNAARHIPGHRVTPKDTNGAGDAHVGAFIAAMAEGHDATEAARLANIAAALSTTEEGPSTAPTKARVLDTGLSQPDNRRLP